MITATLTSYTGKTVVINMDDSKSYGQYTGTVGDVAISIQSYTRALPAPKGVSNHKDFPRAATHYLQCDKGVIALDAKQASIYNDALHALYLAKQAAKDATPEGQREKLQNARNAALDAISGAREADYNQDIGMHRTAKATATYEAAEAALAAFDATHPELKAKLDADRAIRDAKRLEEAERAVYNA